MGEPIHTICCVAELELPDSEDDCSNNCSYKRLETTKIYEESQTYFDAKVFVAAGNLQSYQFDKEPSQNAPGEYSTNLLVRIDYPTEQPFSHLCLKYNREGGPRINVVAVDVDTKEKIRPSAISANGLNWACPIESAIITTSGSTVEVEQSDWNWDDGQMTVILDQHRGAWTISPPSGPGDMELKAHPYLEPENAPPPQVVGELPGGFEFKYWKRNRLSNWVQNEPHQWSGDGATIDFPYDTYTGVIAYYKYNRRFVGDHHLEEPWTKPGPYENNSPAVGWPFLSALRQVWNWIVTSVKRVFRR